MSPPSEQPRGAVPGARPLCRGRAFVQTCPRHQREGARPGAPGCSHRLNNLAVLYQAQGRYAEAEPLCKRALAINEKVLGPEHPDVATSLNILAVLYWAQGRYAEAEPLYKRALAINEKALGPEHPDCRHRSQQPRGALRGARPLCRGRASVTSAPSPSARRRSVPEHPDVVIRLNNLAVIYQMQGRYAEAEPLYKRALAINEKALGPEHPAVGTSLNISLGSTTQGRYTEAESLYERVLANRIKYFGNSHPETEAVRRDLRMKRQRTAPPADVVRRVWCR